MNASCPSWNYENWRPKLFSGELAINPSERLREGKANLWKILVFFSYDKDFLNFFFKLRRGIKKGGTLLLSETTVSPLNDILSSIKLKEN